jgi:hypothetical protein
MTLMDVWVRGPDGFWAGLKGQQAEDKVRAASPVPGERRPLTCISGKNRDQVEIDLTLTYASRTPIDVRAHYHAMILIHILTHAAVLSLRVSSNARVERRKDEMTEWGHAKVRLGWGRGTRAKPSSMLLLPDNEEAFVRPRRRRRREHSPSLVEAGFHSSSRPPFLETNTTLQPNSGHSLATSRQDRLAVQTT